MSNELTQHFRPLNPHGRHSTWSLVYDSPVLHDPIAIDISWWPTDSPAPEQIPRWFGGILPKVGKCIDAMAGMCPRSEPVAFVMRAAITLSAHRLVSLQIEVCTKEGVFWEIVIDDARLPDSIEVDCVGGDYIPSRDYLDRLAPRHSLLNSLIPKQYWGD